MNPASILDRRGFLQRAALALAATQVGLVKAAHAQPLNSLTWNTATPFGAERTQAGTALSQGTLSDGAIRPFRVEVSEAALVDLRQRVEATRWPDQELVDDPSQGVQLATMQELARYWVTEYDWRAGEAKLNALPQFLTEIDGLDIHFTHVRSRHENALPMIMTHGWPGSVVELLKVVGPLTDPTAHGGSAGDAFHIVLPSMPGYGYSGKPTTTGWDINRIARAWVVLMQRLGYSRYVAQGGDWGSPITGAMALQAADPLLGIHVNFPQTVPPIVYGLVQMGEPAPAAFSDAEKRAYDQIKQNAATGRGYIVIQGTRPQTVGFGFADSPVALAAFMLDHDPDSYQKIARAFIDGGSAGDITRDDVLDNISLYWFANTGTSAARLYWENKASVLAATDISLPTAITVFPGEVYQAPRSWAEKAYHNLIYFNEVDKGGHFAAWEQPQLFSQELRAAFRSLR